MFTSFMTDAWIVGGIVGVLGGAVGFFVVLRGQAFAAHAIPNGAFAGAALAALAGFGTLLGLGAFALLAAAGIALLGRRGRQDAATALVLVLMLALGGLLLSFRPGEASQAYALLFGELLGISANQVWPTVALAAGTLVALALLYRPLLLSAALGGRSAGSAIGPAFLAVVALATTMTVPVVGATLIFSLMIGPPAAARMLTARPGAALALSSALSLAVAWGAVALAYLSDLPVGFYVGALAAGVYAAARAWIWIASGRSRRAPALAGS
jgi:zinc/manganese transport system permease protein